MARSGERNTVAARDPAGPVIKYVSPNKRIGRARLILAAFHAPGAAERLTDYPFVQQRHYRAT